MNENKKKFDAIISRAVPSQIPQHVIAKSYLYILNHTKTEFGIAGCRKTGARIKAKAVMMNVYNRTTGLWENYVPVLTLYCAGCDKPPDVHKGDRVFSDQLKTVAV